MELANRLLRARSNVLCVVIGGSPVQRGLDVQFYNQDYRAHVHGTTPPHDPDRIWCLGSVSASVVAELLAVSDLHVYPSHPYVISRSLIEAMSAGCVVLAADTSPAHEFVTHGSTGLMLPPADIDKWEHQALAVLDDRAAHRPLGEAAAALVRERYAQEVTLPKLATLFNQLVGDPD
jgi:glycosyltransferase involved in cell wall biosynthesis